MDSYSCRAWDDSQHVPRESSEGDGGFSVGERTRHPKVSDPPTLKVGYVLYHERIQPAFTIVWGGKDFYRIPTDSYASLPKPLTPLVFSVPPRPQFGRNFGSRHTYTYMASFVRHWTKGDVDFPSPPAMEGHFVKSGLSKAAFVFFSAALDRPIRVVLTPSLAVRYNVYTEVTLSAPLPTVRDPSPSPSLLSVGKFSPSQVVPRDSPTHDLFPEDFLREVRSFSFFRFHMGVGMAETEEFPSLDFSDFCRLGSDPSWVSVQELIKQKVSREAANPSNLLANEFAHSLENYRDHPSHTKSILLFPGRWEGFSYRDAVLLGQSILSESQFSVFIAAAPSTTP